MSIRFTPNAGLSFALFLASIAFASYARAAVQWTPPTDEELKMTSQPEVPGADAVILDHEETIADGDASWTYYYRIKVLTDKGRDDFSNIVVQYPANGSYTDYKVNDLAARTIHSDGTITPFTGKPFDRTVVKGKTGSVHEKVIALPDVQVGSIIEYRYKLQLINDIYYSFSFVPTWYLQSDHFERHQHFRWDCNQLSVAWATRYPPATGTVQKKLTGTGVEFNLDRTNIMPQVDEPDMLPEDAISQKVVFFQTNLNINKASDYWKQQGTLWNNRIESFIGSPSRVAKAATQITAGATTQDEKLRKIYDAVQQLQNTNYLRERSEREDKRNGIKDPQTVADILTQKRGNNLQLNYLFVALARAAGMKAYIMAVTNRDRTIFDPSLILFSQLNDDLSIVEFDGKDRFFDPAIPFCPYGQLLWTHSGSGAIRQTANGTELSSSPLPQYSDSTTLRKAQLTLDPTGQESGNIILSFRGAEALQWRDQLLADDETGLRKNLESYLQDLLPAGSSITLQNIDNLRDENAPLDVTFNVHGPWATKVGKRLLVPSEFFHTREKLLFVSPERKTIVYFDYPELVQDRVILSYPTSWAIESLPPDDKEELPHTSLYAFSSKFLNSDLQLQRTFIFARLTVPVEEYPGLRSYFTTIAQKDQTPIVFHLSATTPATSTAPHP